MARSAAGAALLVATSLLLPAVVLGSDLLAREAHHNELLAAKVRCLTNYRSLRFQYVPGAAWEAACASRYRPAKRTTPCPRLRALLTLLFSPFPSHRRRRARPLPAG